MIKAAASAAARSVCWVPPRPAEVEDEDEDAGGRKRLREHAGEGDDEGEGKGGGDNGGDMVGDESAQDVGEGSAEDSGEHGGEAGTVGAAVVDEEGVEGSERGCGRRQVQRVRDEECGADGDGGTEAARPLQALEPESECGQGHGCSLGGG